MLCWLALLFVNVFFSVDVLRKEVVFAKGTPIIQIVQPGHSGSTPKSRRSRPTKRKQEISEDAVLWKKVKSGISPERNDRQKKFLKGLKEGKGN